MGFLEKLKKLEEMEPMIGVLEAVAPDVKRIVQDFEIDEGERPTVGKVWPDIRVAMDDAIGNAKIGYTELGKVQL